MFSKAHNERQKKKKKNSTGHVFIRCREKFPSLSLTWCTDSHNMAEHSPGVAVGGQCQEDAIVDYREKEAPI